MNEQKKAGQILALTGMGFNIISLIGLRVAEKSEAENRFMALGIFSNIITATGVFLMIADINVDVKVKHNLS
jgi:hypothetical protein